MSLPKRFKIIFHLLIFTLVVVGGSAYAQAIPKTTDKTSTTTQVSQPSDQPPKTSEQTPLPNTTTPDTQVIPLPNGAPGVSQELPSGDPQIQTVACGFLDKVPVAGKVCNSVKAVWDALSDCGANVFCYMAGGVEVVERTAIDQMSGCGNIDQPDGYDDCQKKYQALLNGGTLADVQNPGAIFIAAGAVDAGLRMPVPIDTETYLATINPIQMRTANAQAINELEDSGGLVSIWKNVQNAAFAFSALILVVIGFMIMFRHKLDPRTSVTAMNSLPKVVFAMILIYFSFAISGFMLDMGRLALQVVYRTIPYSGGSVASGLLELLVVVLLSFAGIFLGGPFGVISAVIFVGLILIILLVCIFIFVVMLNLLFQMLKRYVQFIVYTLFSPLFFLWGALPGQSSIGWFKSQLANVLAIPAMFLIIRLAVFIGFASLDFLPGIGDEPILLPSPFDVTPGPAGTPGRAFWVILSPFVAVAMLFYATKMPAIVDGVLGIKDYGSRAGIGAGIIFAPFAAGASLGKALGGLGQLKGQIAGTGTALRNVGWGARPNAVTTPPHPVTGALGPTHYPAPPAKPGLIPSLARGGASIIRSKPKGAYTVTPAQMAAEDAIIDKIVGNIPRTNFPHARIEEMRRIIRTNPSVPYDEVLRRTEKIK